MRLGVNVPNFGTDPGLIREWARVAEDLGYDMLLMSDHIVVTDDVAERYPEPFYEPFTTLSWLAGVTTRIGLGTTVVVLPYRHPLLVARMATNLSQISDGRFTLGVGVGWARQEFAALGVPYRDRGRLTDDYLATLRDHTEAPIWVGGNSDAAIRRAAKFGAAWHPLHAELPWLQENKTRTPLVPRTKVLTELSELEALGAECVVLDVFHGNHEAAWKTLATVAAERRKK